MKSIKYNSSKQDNEVFEEIKERITSYFKATHQSPYANTEMIVKMVWWLLLFVLTYAALIVFRQQALWVVVFGTAHLLTHVMIAFNITHDANHQALFASKSWNKAFSYLIELLGCNRKLWVLAHNQEHHSFTNIHEQDNNIQGYKLLRLCPHDRHYFFHQFQWLYAPLVYGLSTLNFATFRDIKMMIRYTASGKLKWSIAFIIEFVCFKAIYFSYLFFIPHYIFGIGFTYLILFFLIGHLLNGVFLALVFVTGHLTEATAFPEVQNNSIPNNWAMHVIQTTGDYANRTLFWQWLVGGINLHVAHHLFPKICHVHYKNIAPIIKEVVLKHGYAYREIPTFTQALQSHFVLLKQLGQEQFTASTNYQAA